jgi:uncharacterized tellurite resistance protein B-like protein
MEYSYQQKIAIMRILLDIIQADGRIDARELFYFDLLKEQLGLSESDRSAVDKKNSLLALTQVREFSKEQKEEFAKIMSKMIIVDEDININELAIYEVVQDFCAIDKKFTQNLDIECY